MNKKRYPFDPARGFPSGKDLLYRCTICGAEISSAPAHGEPDECKCGNIYVDVDAGRASVREPSKMEIWQIEPGP